MSTFQTMTALVLLIFVLSVFVQAAQEVIKTALDTKASTMKQTINKFMGNKLTLAQIEGALALRGLDVTVLENLSKVDFRQLLDGIQLQPAQLQGIVVSSAATVERVKDNVAASYESVRAAFQKAYTTKNKLFAIGISFLAVISLNANLLRLYDQISADQVVQQAIVGKAAAAQANLAGKSPGGQSQSTDLGSVYAQSRDEIAQALKDYPILIRTSQFKQDFQRPISEVGGLLLMGILVSLGAPFWNDVLKGMMGVNNALNANGSKTS